MWRFCKGFDFFVNVKSPRISALFPLVIFEFTAQKAVTFEIFVPKSLEIVGVCTRRQIWRIHKGFGSFVDVKSPRISALFRLVIFEFTAQKAVTSERFVPHFPYGQQWLKTWHSVHFNFCNFIPITILRAYLSIQFKCRAINNFQALPSRPSKKFRVMQFSVPVSKFLCLFV